MLSRLCNYKISLSFECSLNKNERTSSASSHEILGHKGSSETPSREIITFFWKKKPWLSLSFFLENIAHPRQINLASENHLNVHMSFCDPVGVFYTLNSIPL